MLGLHTCRPLFFIFRRPTPLVPQPAAHAQPLVDLVQPDRRKQALEQPVKAQGAEEPVEEVEDTGEEEADAADDLGEGFCGGESR
jgi:hypothetical protein